MSDLITVTITDAASEADLALRDTDAREIAELALALTRGLEADLTDPDRPRERLRDGIALLIAGLAATAKSVTR
jgi:TetR/AcrR family transcriptional regulator